MKNSRQKSFIELIAGIMAIMMLFVVLFSAFFVVSHAEHDCTGEDCPVCACIQQCEKILHETDEGSLFASVGILPVILITGSLFVSYCIVISDTPVSAKIRMND